MKVVILSPLAAIGGFLGWFLGGFEGFLYTLITCVVIDYITGIMVGIINKELSSKIGFKGIFKKVIIFMLVGLSTMIDLYVIKNGNPIRTAVIFFYIGNEGISILENASIIGLPIPNRLKIILKEFNKEDGDNNE